MADHSADGREVFRFGEYEVSKPERLLLRTGHVVSLQSRPFDLLLYLIENRNRVISREELLRTVWRGVRVNEQAMRFAVHAVRRAIGDSGQAQRIVRTVRGNGLQFIAPVESLVQPERRESIPIDHSFLGREIFLECLGRTAKDVASGKFRILLASGDAGIGKTTALLRAA